MSKRVHVCRPMLSLVLDCGHWDRRPCLAADCDYPKLPPDDPCSRCARDAEDLAFWKDELLDAELLRDRQLRPC